MMKLCPVRFVLVILVSGALFACSKGAPKFDNSTTFVSGIQTQAADQIRISSELYASFHDVDSVLAGADTVCGATVSIDSVDSPHVALIYYSGVTACPLRYHTGTITIQSNPGSNWTAAGDSVIVTFNSLISTRKTDLKTMELSGTYTYYNVSGGSLAGLTSGSAAIVHKIAGYNVLITYDNAASGYWQFSRQLTYTYNGGLVISALGTDSVAGITGISDRGANRFGNSVITNLSSPWVVSQGCGWQVSGGAGLMTNPIGMTAFTMGLDSTGKAATGCPVSGGNYYMQLSWTGSLENPYTGLMAY